IGRLKMRRHKAAARRNATAHQLAQQVVARERKVLSQHYPEGLIVSLTVRRIDNGSYPRHIGQSFLVAMSQLTTARDDAIETRELNQPDRRLNVAHAVVESCLGKFLEHGFEAGVTIRRIDVHAMIAQPMDASREVLIRGNQHSSFSGCDHLAWMEGKRD